MIGRGEQGARSIEDNLDRIFTRLREAPAGLHQEGPPADPRALAQSGLSEEAAPLWSRWDGLDLCASQIVILSLANQEEATAAALAEGRVVTGDRVIAERGRELFVLCADPFEEGADVILIEEDGTRLPYGSRIDRTVLAWLGELTVLFGDDGEYRDELFGDDGELLPAIERRVLRRHLDFDPDAPFVRYRLAQELRREGEPSAALVELRHVLRCAPGFAWAHYERGRALLDEGRSALAIRAMQEAHDAAPRDELGIRAYFLAWACRASEGAAREEIANRARALDGGLVRGLEAGVREAIERGDPSAADELLTLGLAVQPGDLGLLGLRGPVQALARDVAGE
ncbi:MAG: hypothetical protein KC636_18085, partial [Myxococcales bacterium]|nr:hypothetical protein [Myxococcales bacterium]